MDISSQSWVQDAPYTSQSWVQDAPYTSQSWVQAAGTWVCTHHPPISLTLTQLAMFVPAVEKPQIKIVSISS